jgi:gliding motility-associated-like protein
MKKKLKAILQHVPVAVLAMALCLLFTYRASAQVSMTASPTSYSQNFDVLSATSPSTNVTWTDNVTIPGWFTNQSNYRTWSTGDANPSNRIWACGSALGNTDRALGSIMTSTTLRVWGVKLTNNTAATMAAIGIGFDAERYYSAGTGADFVVQYSTTGAIDDAVTSTAWTNIATITTPATGLNYALSGLNLAVGGTVSIRWISAYGGSSSNVALWATDNFTASWGLPAVTTVSAAQTGKTTATANGNITSTGGFASLAASGVCYSSTVLIPTIADSKTTDGILTAGAYTSSITGLTAGTLYHVRAYATNAVGTTYGAVIDITTAAPTLPVLTTTAATAVTPISALSGGNITDDGGRAVTARGVCWSTSTAPTIANSTSPTGSGTGSYSSLLSILTPSTLYYARAYATNAVGTAYGNEITFTTLPAAPTIVVNPTSLSFGTVQQGSNSAQLSYTLAAYYLTPATGTLTITAPAGYRISLTSGSGFVSSLSIPYTLGTVPTTVIYVRFSPTAIANYNNKNITNAGGGATTQNVVVSGDVDPVASQTQQGFSNKGKDFWVGYGATEKMYSDDAQDMRFTFNNPNSSAATVTISIPNQTGFTPLVYTVPANSVLTTNANEIPEGTTAGIDARLKDEGVSNRGIHIESTLPIVVYAHNVTSSVYAASVLFPTPTLGREYTSLNFTQRSNNSVARSFCFAVATENNTTLQVTLPAGIATETHAAGTTFTQTLNKGEVLNLFGQPINSNDGMDLTGVVVKSIGTASNSCKPFAFYSGSSKITIDCSSGSPGSADNLFQQMFPKVAWGFTYVAVPTLTQPVNYYRILVDDPTTVVKVNGTTQTGIVNNTYYEYRNDDASIDVITGDKPIMVAQYMTTNGKCGNPGGSGDPEMIFLSSVQQTTDSVALVSSPLGNSSGRQHFLNVVTKTSAVAGFKLDGAAQVASFLPVPSDPTYSYAQFTVAETAHTLTSPIGFNATAYGIASSESYGYNAGTNLRDLFTGFNVQNQFGSGSSPNACRGSEFYMRVTLAFRATSITWDFGSNANLSPNASVTQTNPTPEDSVTINGTKLYIYKLPTPYIYNAIGTFNVTINALSPTPDGCNGIKTFTFPVTVVQGPTADFTFTNNGCLVPVQFTNASQGNGYTIDQLQWDFVDPTTAPNNVSTIPNPVHSFSAGGTYPVKLRVITTEGCYADATKNVALSAVPVAAFTQSASTCETVAVAFNSTTSTIAPVGTISTWAWNFGDPSSGANNTNATQNPSHTFATANNYTVSLTVTSSTGCPSVPLTKTITVSPKPVADFTFTNSGCAKDLVTFNGLPNAMTTYAWNFGETGSPTNTASTQNATHQYAAAGTFNPSLTVTSAQGCVGTVTKPVTLAASLANPVVTVTTIGATSLTFSWPAVTGATGYQVSIDGINFITPSSGATGLTHTVTGLTANQSVTLTVRAVAALACQSTTGNATGLTLYPDVGLFVPNTFTPNGDGKNDVLKAYGNYLQKMNMKIFNQWGEKVYESNDVNGGGWDGNCRGQQQPVGVYVYVVIATMPDGRVINKKGTINLIR